jgi:hypothetical protein
MICYVYLHLDKDGIVRYVGKGTGLRAYKKTNRSKVWLSLFSENPPEIVIVKTNLSNLESLDLEEALIGKYSSTIINFKKSSRTKELNFEQFNEKFYVSSESKTGLKWKNTLSNKVKNGDDAGYLKKPNGKEYYAVVVNDKEYYAHRVVYLLTHKTLCTTLVINHIDGDGTNNSVSNLEAITQRENSLRCKISKNNTSGFNGVRSHFYKGIFRGFVTIIPILGHKTKSKLFSLSKYSSEEECLIAAKNYQQNQMNLILENIKKEDNGK